MPFLENGLTKTSYVFGTIHLQCTNDFIIKEKVKTALNNTKEIYFEVDLDDPDMTKKMMADIANGKKLSDDLNEDELKKLDAVLQERLGMTVKMLDSYSLGLVAGLLSFSEIKCEEKSAYEAELMKLAKEKGMEVQGIETIEFQLETLKNGWTKESALNHIYNPKYYNLVQVMLDAYVNEDLQKLTDAVQNFEFMNEQEIKHGIEIRNSNWAKLMPKIMQKQNTFFAYGAGHLGSKIGVLNLLKEQGFTVTPIFDNTDISN
jgi:uncharacterized protein YbaP (TraB family)